MATKERLIKHRVRVAYYYAVECDIHGEGAVDGEYYDDEQEAMDAVKAHIGEHLRESEPEE